MIPLIEQKRDAVAALCRRYNVQRLELFGSAASDDPGVVANDLDFLVEFAPGEDLGPWLAHYFEFRDNLQRLFGRKVDLVMRQALKNPYFIREVNRTRKLFYAA
ncbi:MAG: nucleotidyltransferase domain-containing protein [Candidatus Hydrogenedentes bacterium]|nr:nucleotidyltransferase domain-containing protein [Candidatus Hydrogenedentota bacterium]